MVLKLLKSAVFGMVSIAILIAGAYGVTRLVDYAGNKEANATAKSLLGKVELSGHLRDGADKLDKLSGKKENK